jgi:CBS domain containing-hemolysin-like protein
MQLIIGIIFLIASVITVILQKAYFELPESEVKKRKNIGDNQSRILSQTLAYGPAIKVLLIFLASLFSAITFTMLTTVLPVWVSIIILTLIIYYLSSLLPNTKVSRIDSYLVKLLSPLINKILSYIAPYLNMLYKHLARHYVKNNHNIFDEQDLLHLIDKQPNVLGNRISSETIAFFKASFDYQKLTVKDIMIPNNKLKALKASDVIGPVLINELHQSGHDYALVKDKGEIIGLIAFSNLSIKSEGKVLSYMNKQVYFVNQSAVLNSVIKAFWQTKSPVFFVTNAQSKVVGIITVEIVTNKLLGNLDKLNLDDYSNIEAVATLPTNLKD